MSKKIGHLYSPGKEKRRVLEIGLQNPIRALARLPAQKAARLKRILASRPTGHLQIEQTFAIIASTDALAYARAKAQELEAAALAALQPLPQNPARNQLAELIERVT